jgi:LysR family transcriptional regulator for metE and metH
VDFRHLKLVKSVAEEGSLTSASKKLYLTQSALSYQLKEIEDKFGAQLFQRINKKMVLTPIGRRVLDSAHVILSEIEKIENDVKSLVSGDTGVLRISTECYTCYHWLPALLKSFNRRFPNVEVQIIAEATPYPLEYLRNGKLDLAIVSERNDHNQVLYKKLFTDELVAVVNEEHFWRAKPFVSPEDFAHETLIMYTVPRETSTLFRKFLDPAGVTPKKIIQVPLTEARIEMVKAGLGVTVLAQRAVKPHLDSGKLVTLPLTKNGLPRTWYAAIMKNGHLPNYLKSFIRHLCSKL